MLQVEMSASVRETSGKGPMRQLRMKGMTPAVVYGGGEEALKLQLDTKILMTKLLKYYRYNTVVTLKVEGSSEKSVTIGEVQTDPARDTLVHVDFCEIDLEKDREFSVPVVYQGVAKGVDLGGRMTVHCPEIVLKGKPLDIPDECYFDVTKLEIGESVKVGDIVVPGNVSKVTSADAMAIYIEKIGEKVEVDEDAPEAEEPVAEEAAAE